MPTADVKQVYEVAIHIQTQQTNCLYTEHGQRIAYYTLPDGNCAFLDIDRGIYGFIQGGLYIRDWHAAYLNNNYELWHDTYRIGYKTIEHARKLEYPALTR